MARMASRPISMSATLERVTVHIRTATRRDASLILHWHRQLYVTHRERIVPSELEAFYAHHDMEGTLREDVGALLQSPDATVLIAERDGVPVGYVTGHIDEDERRVLARKGVVEDWFVDEEARGEGVGAALMKALEETFRKKGCQVVESMTWSSNDGARRAHAALGFHEVQVRFRKRL